MKNVKVGNLIQMAFNRSGVKVTPHRECIEPSKQEISSTPGLLRASFDDAVRFGGGLTREVLGSCPITGERKYLCIDTKVHMLFPGMNPAIPGWHTDGAPRGAQAGPDLVKQQNITAETGEGSIYHLMVIGNNSSLTEVALEPTYVPVSVEPRPDTYARMTNWMEQHYTGKKQNVNECEWNTFDWWQIHRGIAATDFGWRFLIRVTESNDTTPLTNAREIIRTQQQVYVSSSYGW